MSDSDRPRGELRRSELETVTCWPLIGVAVGVLVGLGTAAVALGVAGSQTRPIAKLQPRSQPPDASAPDADRLACKDGSSCQTSAARPESLDQAVLKDYLTIRARTLDLAFAKDANDMLWQASTRHRTGRTVTPRANQSPVERPARVHGCSARGFARLAAAAGKRL